MGLKWNGAAVEARMLSAARIGIDRTLADAVKEAKDNHPWENETGTLEGSLRMQAAELYGAIMRGRWGSFDVNYALWLEIGTSKMPAYPFLLPAADATYPSLRAHIREAWIAGRIVT